MCDRGFVLVVTLLIIFCVSALVISLAASTSIEHKMTLNFKQKIEAFILSQNVIRHYKKAGRVTYAVYSTYNEEIIQQRKEMCHKLYVTTKFHHASSSIETVFCGKDNAVLWWREVT